MAEAPWRVELLEDGVLRTATFGSLDEEEARAFVNAFQERIAQLPEPARILGDARRSGRHARAAHRLLMESTLHLPPAYMAIVGSGLRVRLWVRLLAHNSLLKEVRFFAREEDALAWLRSLAVGPKAAGPAH